MLGPGLASTHRGKSLAPVFLLSSCRPPPSVVGSSPRKRTQRKVFFFQVPYSGELLANLPNIFENNGNKNFLCFMIGWGYRTYICPKIVVNAEQCLPFAMFLLSVL